jgi:NAD(P)-dependent dehydrogenase (short-subunit alcohol dehydrogenase family)
MRHRDGLQNKRVAILGGSSGIGLAVAEQRHQKAPRS